MNFPEAAAALATIPLTLPFDGKPEENVRRFTILLPREEEDGSER
jgi:hypothetical protein